MNESGFSFSQPNHPLDFYTASEKNITTEEDQIKFVQKLVESGFRIRYGKWVNDPRFSF